MKQNCPFFAVKRGNSSFSAWSMYLLFPLSPCSLLAGETFLDGSCWISSINPCFAALTAGILTKLKFRTGSHLWVEFVECSVVEDLLECVSQLQSSETTVFCPFSMILFWFCAEDF